MRVPARESRGRRAASTQGRSTAAKRSKTDRDVIEDRLRGWWAEVIAGQLEHRHPVYGTALRLRFDGDEVVVTGMLQHKRELTELRSQLRRLSAGAGPRVRLKVSVEDPHRGEEGLLEQTIIGVFETAERAEFACHLLEAHATARPRSMTALRSADVGSEKARHVIPPEYRAQVREALRKGNTLLVVTVDEVQAFGVRELIDEETRSLMTLTLPPRAIAAASKPKAHSSTKRAAPRRATKGRAS